MQKTTKLVISLVVVVLVVAGGVILFGSKKATSPSSNTNNSGANTTKNGDATITYDGSTFEPSTITIKKGQSIRIVNQSSSTQLSFESNPHPTHTDNGELNTGDIDPGVSKTITVNKTGTWGYHNHFAPSQSGKIIVTN